MENALIVRNDPSSIDILVPDDAEGNIKSRLSLYSRWLDQNRSSWYMPNLKLYRDYLLNERKLEAASVQAHLSTVRSRYAELVLDRDLFYAMTNADFGVLERKAVVDELIQRVENAINPKAAKVKVKTVQDESDLTHIRLTEKQADALIRAPGIDTLSGLRDTAMIAVMLCTGLREGELAALQVGDLYQVIGGEPALLVREGKGMKQRLIPYGELAWVLTFVEAWLRRTGIEGGFVFHRILKDGKTVGKTALTTRAIQKRLAAYPIWINNRLIAVHPHDLRRTYARRLYEASVDVVRIQQNLGHANLKTTLRYIGNIDANARRPPSVYKTPSDLLQQMVA